MARQYWAHPFGKPDDKVGPFDTREDAVAKVFATTDAVEATSGYGTYGPSFDIRWIKREQR